MHSFIHSFAVSHLYGFGLMDAEAMVTEAERWTHAPPHRVCVDNIVYGNR